MIGGTLVLEDSILQFRRDQDGDDVEVTVADGPLGEQESYSCRWDDFCAAMQLALSTDGAGGEGVTAETMHAAERAMPTNATLRWIP